MKGKKYVDALKKFDKTKSYELPEACLLYTSDAADE